LARPETTSGIASIMAYMHDFIGHGL